MKLPFSYNQSGIAPVRPAFFANLLFHIRFVPQIGGSLMHTAYLLYVRVSRSLWKSHHGVSCKAQSSPLRDSRPQLLPLRQKEEHSVSPLRLLSSSQRTCRMHLKQLGMQELQESDRQIVRQTADVLVPVTYP